MDLQQFVKNVLVDIDKSVTSARQETNRDIKFSSLSSQRTVEFDIAVAVDGLDPKIVTPILYNLTA